MSQVLGTDTAEFANKPLSVPTMAKYGIGQAGAQIFRDTPAALLPVFMVTILGIPAWLAGVVILIPKLWIIFSDPLVGAWSDRRANDIGRTPFLMVGALVSSLGFLALFSFSGFSNPYLASVVMAALLLVAMTGFSAFSVPYLALAASLSSDTHERTKLLVFRMVATSLGVMFGIGLAQPTVMWLGGDARAWQGMAAIFSVICLAAMMTTALGLRKTKLRPLSSSAGKSKLLQQFIAAWQNRPFRILTIIHAIQTLAQAVSYTVVAFIFIYLVGRIELLMVFVFLMSICGPLMQPVWLKLSRSLGKSKLFIILCLVWMAITATWMGINFGSSYVVTLPLLGETTGKELLILLRGAAIGMANAGFLLIVTSMFTDTVYLGKKDSEAAEGSYAGLWQASEKLAFAVGPLVAGIVLSATGFVSSKSGMVTQPDSALLGLLANYSLLPMLLFIISLLFMPAYNRSVRATQG